MGSKEVFEYQSRLFRAAFDGIMEFHVLDGTFAVTTEDDPKIFVDMGFKMPLRSWYGCGEWRSKKDGTPAPAQLEGIEETIAFLI